MHQGIGRYRVPCISQSRQQQPLYSSDATTRSIVEKAPSFLELRMLPVDSIRVLFQWLGH